MISRIQSSNLFGVPVPVPWLLVFWIWLPIAMLRIMAAAG
jgi:hypothetical protein